MPTRQLAVRSEVWPLKGSFRISRGARTEAVVVVVEVIENGVRGWGECVPYARYQESVASVIAQIEDLRGALEQGLSRTELQSAIAAGAARNAIDCALWDLQAKQAGRSAAAIAGINPRPATTAYTLSLESPTAMAKAARAADRPLLKLKLGGDGDLNRVAAVREAVPTTKLIVDANEAWQPEMLPDYLPAMAALNVSLVEQPLPAANDGALAEVEHAVPICADESFHTSATLDDVADRYDFINIKLDKTGGLTEALTAARLAKERGLGIMVGCMIGTSLAMAPAALLGPAAEFLDLDGPLLLARDRSPGLRYETSTLYPPEPGLWG